MNSDLRIPALRRFAAAISILNILGHTVLGFEQSLAQVLVSLGTAYGAEIVLETLEARAKSVRPKYLAGGLATVDFFLPAHISGLACAMLLYANDRLAPVAFAAGTAIASKALFRLPIHGQDRHFLNPSNTGIACTLLAFPWVGVAMPYQFTENVTGAWDWILPGIIICSGSFLNARFTRRLPLIAAWLGTFALQAVARATLLGTHPWAPLSMMTGLAFLLFTFYMVTDPATTPHRPRGQVIFGAAVAVAYAFLQLLHVVYGLFFALFTICILRGVVLYALGNDRILLVLGRAPRSPLEPESVSHSDGPTIPAHSGEQ